jgi:hypothetical protein
LAALVHIRVMWWCRVILFIILHLYHQLSLMPFLSRKLFFQGLSCIFISNLLLSLRW